MYEFDGFYSVRNDRAIMERRLQGNACAQEFIPIAQRQAMRIAKFPFVRAVMASGSLSKNYMDDESDLDFFIVTSPGRLWIARTLLIIYKRIFLLNSHKYFCVNYFVDEKHLEIEERNLFTATELATVIPMYNYGLYRKLIEQNVWINEMFPNFRAKKTSIEKTNGFFVKRIAEKCLDLIANPFDRLLMKMTLLRWERKYKKLYPPDQFHIAFKTKEYASKNHPRNFQKKVMDAYYKKQLEFNGLHRVTHLQ